MLSHLQLIQRVMSGISNKTGSFELGLPDFSQPESISADASSLDDSEFVQAVAVPTGAISRVDAALQDSESNASGPVLRRWL